MRVQKLFTALLLASLGGAASADVNLVSTNGVQQGTVVTEKFATYALTVGGGVQMTLSQRYSAFGLNVGSMNWSAYTHLGVTITNNKNVPAVIQVVIDSGTSSVGWTDFVIGANKTQDLVIPLQAPTMAGWNASPSNLQGFSQSPLFGGVTKSSVKKIRISNPLRTEAQNLTLHELTAITLTTPTSGLIDIYGQQTLSFPGKVASDTQLAAQVSLDNQLSGQLPYPPDSYGGVAGSGIDAGTGKWRTAKQNGRWYIITPGGDRFFSTGIVATGVGTLAITRNRESQYVSGAIPTSASPLYPHLIEIFNPSTGANERAYNFYTANLQRKYGTNWMNSDDEVITRRLRSWGFNTMGPSSRWSLYNPNYQTTNMREVGITGSFKKVPTPGAAFPMPDPYDPAWANAVSAKLTPLVAEYNADPYNAGLFVDNELQWAQHWQEPNYRYDLAYNILSSEPTQPSKQRFQKNLSLKYRTIQKLNSSWGTTYTSWTAFLANRNFRPTTPNANLTRDMKEFLTAFATQYFSTIKNKLTTLGYKGLYLGSRFAYFCPEALVAAARYCDVVSFNCYDVNLTQWRAELKALDAPVMVGEFAFSASDLGRVGGGGPTTMTEDQRVEAYKAYIEDAKAWPNLVGLHWYKWEDDPVTGRLWDNANHTLGLVSITDIPYTQMVAAATQANTELNSRLLNP